MSVGLTLPMLSAWDPGAIGEGSLDPCGLAALSDRLADRLVPGLRARMQRVRFVTAMAVGAAACQTLMEEVSGDGGSTPAICFEWLVVESFVRKIAPAQMPSGVPGSQKARRVVGTGGRLRRETYLKAPSVFGFNGIYKPFAVDCGLVDRHLVPGPSSRDLLHAWESDCDLVGFADSIHGSAGGRLRRQLRNEVHNSLGENRCATNPRSRLFEMLSNVLHPSRAGKAERHVLRLLVVGREQDERTELATLLTAVADPEHLSEAGMLAAIRPSCSLLLRQVVEAVMAYESLAKQVDAAFRTLCTTSYRLGTQPMTATQAAGDPTVTKASRAVPELFARASDALGLLGLEPALSDTLGDFAMAQPTPDFVAVLMQHHERVQKSKSAQGKLPWFTPMRAGWIVRGAYGTTEPPVLSESFVHPIRLAPLARFLRETAV